ncbi:FAD binding domain-containing protein [Suillus lakei]|nr:FAD binding domain-containing protein [Suillus lakei]
MNSTHPLVLVVGAGPVGLVAALTLLQNGIPVRIIDKDPNPCIRQRGPGIWPRSLELFNFLNVPEVNNLSKLAPVIRSYRPGTLEPLQDYPLAPHMESTPAVPFHAIRMMGQQLLEIVMQNHLEKFSCSVKMGTELRSFKQSNEGVTAVLMKNGISETFDTKWMIGADGARGIMYKQLVLKFLGETRDDVRAVTGDIHLKGVGLDRVYWHQFGKFGELTMFLHPTDEIAKDGWQFYIFGPELDLTKVAQNEELVFEIIALLMPMEVTFNKLVWMTCFRTNIRMVNKFSEGHVFVAGNAAHPTGGQVYKMPSIYVCWKLALVEKGLAGRSLLETYSAERLPVISEMLEMTTSILNQTITTGDVPIRRSTVLFMLGINCRFSNIVLDEFAIPGKPIDAYGVFDEGHLEAGDRAPDAPNMLQVGGGESDVKTLFGLYRPWHHTTLVFAPSPADATPIMGALEAYDKSVMQSAVVLPSSASVMPVASPPNHVLVDQEDYAYSAYLMEAGQTKVFVIRPDGGIGAIVHGAGGVKKYFSKIFLDA